MYKAKAFAVDVREDVAVVFLDVTFKGETLGCKIYIPPPPIVTLIRKIYCFLEGSCTGFVGRSVSPEDGLFVVGAFERPAVLYSIVDVLQGLLR